MTGIADEFESITVMVKEAEKHGLLVEVISSYTGYIRSGDSIAEAVHAALYDWDI